MRLDGVEQNYQAYVYQWDSNGHNITGPALYTSAIQQAPSSMVNFIPVTIDTINVPIVAEQEYILFLTTLNVSQNGDGYYTSPKHYSDVYTGGNLIFNFADNAADFTQTSLQNIAPSLQSVFALEHSDITDVLT